VTFPADWQAAVDADLLMPIEERWAAEDEARALSAAEYDCEERARGQAMYVSYAQAAELTGLSVGFIRKRVKDVGVEVIGSSRVHRVRWGELREALRAPAEGRPGSGRVVRLAGRRRSSGTRGRFTAISKESIQAGGMPEWRSA
jgi:hypothetical protein